MTFIEPDPILYLVLARKEAFDVPRVILETEVKEEAQAKFREMQDTGSGIYRLETWGIKKGIRDNG